MNRRHKKYDLLARITQSINEDGWNIFYLSDPAFHPFRLKVYRESESFSIKIYIWHLTHGGGVKRPAHEYRIQITGVDQFEQEIGGKTLILGWWEPGGVFAGFDCKMHAGTLGFSPSIQIGEEALWKANLSGFATWVKDNKEIAIAFRPDFLVEYIRNLESLHSFGESDEDVEVLEHIIERPDGVNLTEIQRVSEPRKIAITNITRKVRDNSFKKRVLAAYRYQCAFCGIQLRLVDAAHILPVSYEGSSDETSNGLALCTLHHRAYDNALVTVNREYQIIHNEAKMVIMKDIGLDSGAEKFINDLYPVILIPSAVKDRPHVEYIEKANEIRGWELNF